MPPDPHSVTGFRLRALLLQNNLGETLCSNNFGHVGQSMSVLVKANNVTKKNIKRDIVEQYIFLLFWPLPITPMEKCLAKVKKKKKSGFWS